MASNTYIPLIKFLESSNTYPTLQQLLESLEYDILTVKDDMRTALSLTESKVDPRYLLGSEEFTEAWVSGKQESWKRAVIGSKEPYGTGVSVVSKEAAQIIESVEKVEHGYTLVYFCGLHQGSNDPEIQATRLTKSLLAQLLNGILNNKDPIDLKMIPFGAVLAAMEGTLEGLQSVLQGLIFRLPEGSVVHCVVDNIGLYWNDDLGEDCGAERVLQKLRGMKDRLHERNENPLNPLNKVFLKILFSSGPENGPFKEDDLEPFLFRIHEIHVLNVEHPEKSYQ